MSEIEKPIVVRAAHRIPRASPLREHLISLVAGGVGGAFAVITGHPFDLIKVRCQSGEASSMSHAIREILQGSRGSLIAATRGFYKGMIPPLLGVIPTFALSFCGYDVGKRFVTYGRRFSQQSESLTLIQLAMAGFISAIPMTLIMAPMERTKVMLQTTEGYTLISAGKKLFQEGGIQSLFRGSIATFARDGPGCALYFAAYERTRKLLAMPGEKEFSILKTCISGGMAGLAMWSVVFPIDTIKTRLQVNGSQVSFKEGVKEIYVTRGGIRGFFPGLGPALLRSFPANAATFVGVELTHSVLSNTPSSAGLA